MDLGLCYGLQPTWSWTHLSSEDFVLSVGGSQCGRWHPMWSPQTTSPDPTGGTGM